MKLPAAITLPVRGRVRLAGKPPRGAAESMRGALDALAALAIEHGGQRLDPRDLALEDFHVLRAALIRAGVIAERERDHACENCGETMPIAPCRSLELGPFLDDELDDDELDEPFDFAVEHEVPGARVTLRPVTVRDAEALLFACDRGPVRRLTGELARAMGLAKLDDETHPARIARRLRRADDDAFDAVLDLFDRAHYGPRLQADVRCPSCGASNLVEAPAHREFPALPRALDPPTDGFPSDDDFAALVDASTERHLTASERASVAVIVEPGVPACDDGGGPLLGSYDPPFAGLPPRGAEIRLYLRTFRAMWRDDGPFDVAAEIDETVEHELAHHRAFLRGHDEVDDEERAEIAREARRRIGERESVRRASSALRGEIAGFVRTTWPVWVLGAAIAVAYGACR